MKNIRKGFVLPLLIVIGVLVIGGGIYLYSKNKKTETQIVQNTTPGGSYPIANVVYQIPENIILTGIYEINNWKTYKNDKYGYEFQYPKNFTLESQELDPYGTNTTTTSDMYVYSGKRGYTAKDNTAHFEFEVSILQSSQTKANLSLKDYSESKWLLNKNDTNPNVKNKKVGNMESVIINGHQAYKFDVTMSYTGGKGGYLLDEETTFIFTEANSKIYSIKFPTSNNLNSKKILSTFKFTK